MTKNVQGVLLKKSRLTTNGKPNLPAPSKLVEGELAINYAEGVETISTKNESGTVVTFSSDNYYTEQKLGSGFTGVNSAKTVTEAIEEIQPNVNADWDEQDETSPAFILNKPFGDVCGDITAYDDELTLHYAGQYGGVHMAGFNAIEGELAIGNVYTISIDGNEVERTCVRCYDGTTEVRALNLDEDSTISRPTSGWSIISYDGTWLMFFSASTEGYYDDININLGIEYSGCVINKLDEKYIDGAWEKGDTKASAQLVGSNCMASGIGSVAEGQYTRATNTSHAEGGNTIASGTYSHAEGQITLSSGHASHAEGSSTSATSTYSHAEGHSTIASGPYSHTEGSGTTAEGYYSHAEGYGTKTVGMASHAEGQTTSATSFASHAEGLATLASGEYGSHAEGNSTIASGISTHAEGHYSKAFGNYSHAEGFQTKALNRSEHSCGQNNISSSASTTFGHSGNTLFSVGNGSNTTPHNAFEIRQNGDIYITNKDGNDVKLQDEIGKVDVDLILDETTSASTNAVATSAVYDFVTASTPTVDQVLDDTTSASTNPVSSKAVYDAVTDNELVWTNAYVALSGTVSAHTANTEIHVTAADKEKLHTHSNKASLDSITGNVGTMAYEAANSYSSATEVNTALGNKLEASDVADFFDDAKYELSGTTHVINFYNDNTIKATIDAEPFIVDGMVESVSAVTSGNTTVLDIKWNTAAGGQETIIDIGDIFEADNYYQKSQTSGATELATAFGDINDIIGSGFTSSSITDVIIENEEITSAALTDLNTNKLDVTAYTPVDLSNYYTKSQTSGASEISTALSDKASQTDLDTLSGTVTSHTASINDLSENKADKATTLAGYGITNAYTKSEIDTMIGNIETLLAAI